MRLQQVRHLFFSFFFVSPIRIVSVDMYFSIFAGCFVIKKKKKTKWNAFSNVCQNDTHMRRTNYWSLCVRCGVDIMPQTKYDMTAYIFGISNAFAYQKLLCLRLMYCDFCDVQVCICIVCSATKFA